MTTRRDQAQDRARTGDMIRRAGAGRPDNSTNWLGHRLDSGAARIDAALLIGGATREELGATRGAVARHLYHNRQEHGLRVIENQGRLMFDRSDLGA